MKLRITIDAEYGDRPKDVHALDTLAEQMASVASKRPRAT